MSIKRKNVLVGTLSSLIIAIVFVSTLAGYSLYIQFVKDSFALRYRSSIYKLTADLFSKDIQLSNLNIRTGGAGLTVQAPVVEGSVRNNSNKTITSMLIEVSFLRNDGTVVYNDWIFPLGDQPEEKFTGRVAAFSGMNKTSNVLLSGEGLSFRHLLRNCPKDITAQMSRDRGFIKKSSKDRIKMICKLRGLGVS